jgi:hypothetical protein
VPRSEAAAFCTVSRHSVDRELLFWKLEHQLGVAAHTLTTLRDLYRGTRCTVKVDGRLLQPAFWGAMRPAPGLPS